MPHPPRPGRPRFGPRHHPSFRWPLRARPWYAKSAWRGASRFYGPAGWNAYPLVVAAPSYGSRSRSRDEDGILAESAEVLAAELQDAGYRSKLVWWQGNAEATGIAFDPSDPHVTQYAMKVARHVGDAAGVRVVKTTASNGDVAIWFTDKPFALHREARHLRRVRSEDL